MNNEELRMKSEEFKTTGMTPEFVARAEQIAKPYEHKQAALLPLLRLCQERDGYVTSEVETWVSEYLCVPLVHVHEVVSFYTLYYRRPMGKHVIDVCRNISCTLRGGEEVLKALEQHLGIKEGETTPDGKYSLQTVECLCACEQAPVLQVDGGHYVGSLNLENIMEALPK